MSSGDTLTGGDEEGDGEDEDTEDEGMATPPLDSSDETFE